MCWVMLLGIYIEKQTKKKRMAEKDLKNNFILDSGSSIDIFSNS